MRRTWIFGAVLVLFSPSTGQSADSAATCAALKLKGVSKYASCYYKTAAIAAKKGKPADYSGCTSKFLAYFDKAESKAGAGGCASEGDASTVSSIIVAGADGIITGATGGGYEACDGGVVLACGARGIPNTGQATAFGAGSDGAIQAGCDRSYTDNGDGTITDNCTGLMWEKKNDDDGSVHNRYTNFSWSGASYSPGDESPSANIMDGSIATFIATLNGALGGSAGGFAGYTDWRVPSLNELLTLGFHGDVETWPDFEIPIDPIFAAAGCSGCTDNTLPTCSCSSFNGYWTSTTDPTDSAGAFWVGAPSGNFELYTRSKNEVGPIRAVRGP